MFKKIFKDLLESKFTISMIVGFIVVLLCHFVVFPGLTAANTLINIGSFIFGVILLMFLFFYVKHQYFTSEESELYPSDPNKEPETELDYIPTPKPKTKRKPTTTRKKSTSTQNKKK